jgi:hypothetical protein
MDFMKRRDACEQAMIFSSIFIKSVKLHSVIGINQNTTNQDKAGL